MHLISLSKSPTSQVLSVPCSNTKTGGDPHAALPRPSSVPHWRASQPQLHSDRRQAASTPHLGDQRAAGEQTCWYSLFASLSLTFGLLISTTSFLCQVKEQVSRYPDFEDQRGRVTSTVRISWDPPAYFMKGIAHVACHALVGGHTTTATKEIYLDPASSAAFNHPYASAGTVASYQKQKAIPTQFNHVTWLDFLYHDKAVFTGLLC